MDGSTGNHLTGSISSVILTSERTGIHPCSRLREKKESEIQPAWERDGNSLEPVSVILQDITDALFTGCSSVW